MALRRAPTRIELKADDIGQYDEILRERQEAAMPAPNPGGGRQRGRYDVPPAAKRKVSVSERIGVGQGNRCAPGRSDSGGAW
mmetsp:Transcript_27801/g.55670  ORF Transcript_27801/g.55670 Transcript_27801/m.55670 type:complete len:82 (+) Transcript_27801:125-370(+)